MVGAFYVPSMSSNDPSFPYATLIRRKFFMPEMKPSAAEDWYQILHSAILRQPASGPRIQRLRYVRDGLPFTAEVGDARHRGEPYVMAILGPSIDDGSYYIATIRRGFENPNDAIFVHAKEVREVELFL